MEDYPIECEGIIEWFSDHSRTIRAELTSAKFRSATEILLEFHQNVYQYTVILNSIDGFLFPGSYAIESNDYSDSGTYKASLYKNQDKFLLFGIWIEDGDEFQALVRFRSVSNAG